MKNTISFINFTRFWVMRMKWKRRKFQLNNTQKWKQFKCKWFTYLPTYRLMLNNFFYYYFVDIFFSMLCANLAAMSMVVWYIIVRENMKSSYNCNKHDVDDDCDDDDGAEWEWKFFHFAFKWCFRMMMTKELYIFTVWVACFFSVFLMVMETL